MYGTPPTACPKAAAVATSSTGAPSASTLPPASMVSSQCGSGEDGLSPGTGRPRSRRQASSAARSMRTTSGKPASSGAAVPLLGSGRRLALAAVYGSPVSAMRARTIRLKSLSSGITILFPVATGPPRRRLSSTKGSMTDPGVRPPSLEVHKPGTGPPSWASDRALAPASTPAVDASRTY